MFYTCRPLYSPAQTLTNIENSVGLAYNTDIGKIIPTGNYNLNYLADANKSGERKGNTTSV